MKNIDVIIPTFNSEKTIEKALNSIVLANEESMNTKVKVLIADGGSKDGTINKIDSYDKDLDIEIVSHKDINAEEGMSKGFNASSGDYIMILGSDDYLSKDYLLEFENTIIKDKDILFPSSMKIIKVDSNGNSKVKRTKYARKFKFFHRYTIPLPGLGWIVKGSSLRDFVIKRGGMLYNNSCTLSSDNEVLFSMLKAGWNYTFMDNINTCYYFVEGGRSSSDLITVTYEACRIACENSKNFNIDIKLIYYLRRQLIRLTKLIR